MFSKLFGKKSDHPLADIKSAQALLDDLPRNDPHKLVMEVTDWIESVSGNPDFKIDYRFAVLRLLDETAQPYLRKLMADYFTPAELNQFQENRLWLVLGTYFRNVSGAYLSILKNYAAGEKGAAALKPQLPMLAIRALNAMIGQLKYACAHYASIDNSFWSDVAKICKHAEQQQYLDTVCELYTGAASETTVKTELGRLVAWYGCGVSSLSPLAMHLTERIIFQYRPCVEIGASVDAHSLFSLDLDRPLAPMRVKVEATTHAQMRFVNMWTMKPKLESLIQILEKNVVPDDIDLGRKYPAEIVREAARYLLNYIVSPPLRRNTRRSIRVDLSVVNSFAKVVEQTNVGLNFSNEQPLRWQIEDISVDGFRTVLPVQSANGIHIGCLFGVQPDGMDGQWGVAVVRRMTRDDAKQLHVGAEILSNHIVGVNLSVSGGGGGGFEAGQAALWLLSAQEIVSGEAQIIMKAETFSMNRSLQTAMNGKRYLLIPNALISKGRDYDFAQFRVIEQEEATGAYQSVAG